MFISDRSNVRRLRSIVNRTLLPELDHCPEPLNHISFNRTDAMARSCACSYTQPNVDCSPVFDKTPFPLATPTYTRIDTTSETSRCRLAVPKSCSLDAATPSSSNKEDRGCRRVYQSFGII